jgi:hypothetical protein
LSLKFRNADPRRQNLFLFHVQNPIKIKMMNTLQGYGSIRGFTYTSGESVWQIFRQHATVGFPQKVNYLKFEEEKSKEYR